MRGYAYYSPAVDGPPGGLCLSAFALLRRGPAFLAVRPKPHERWREWAPNWDVYDAPSLARQYELWRLPAAYLREGEGPDATVRRVVEGQLGATAPRVGAPRVVPFHDASSRFPGEKHWDLCFVYDVQGDPAPLARLPWLAELRWFEPGEARDEDFGSAIGDLARELGLARGGSAPAGQDRGEPAARPPNL